MTGFFWHLRVASRSEKSKAPKEHRGVLGSDFSGVRGYTVVARAEARTVCPFDKEEAAARGGRQATRWLSSQGWGLNPRPLWSLGPGIPFLLIHRSLYLLTLPLRGITVGQCCIDLSSHVNLSREPRRLSLLGWTLGNLFFHGEEGPETFTTCFWTLAGIAFVRCLELQQLS